MPKKFEDFNNPRKKALAGMKQSISAELWDKNLNFLTQLRAKIAKHPVSHHPAIETFSVHDKFHRTLILSGFCL
ncbi:hypothetical protein RZS21_20535, partial [Acinetobacter baumannii]|nr:hypothetical protein [Acinetobacter baumannii]